MRSTSVPRISKSTDETLMTGAFVTGAFVTGAFVLSISKFDDENSIRSPLMRNEKHFCFQYFQVHR